LLLFNPPTSEANLSLTFRFFIELRLNEDFVVRRIVLLFINLHVLSTNPLLVSL